MPQYSLKQIDRAIDTVDRTLKTENLDPVERYQLEGLSMRLRQQRGGFLDEMIANDIAKRMLQDAPDFIGEGRKRGWGQPDSPDRSGEVFSGKIRERVEIPAFRPNPTLRDPMAFPRERLAPQEAPWMDVWL